ncbi:hypothetical protein ACFV2S_02565 [Streptomyces sp. NPDC059695]|uniref:hypothetical protein n=1 Tax=Streptomyces sp. NPDC059695 TaxID=3346910 RepID=UPI003692EC39
MMRRVSAMVVAAASLLGAGITMAAPAQAASCTPDNACLYSDSDFEGLKRDDYRSQSSWASIHYDGFPDAYLYWSENWPLNVSSVDNWDVDTRISVYYHSQWTGPCFKIANYGSVSNLAYVTLSSGQNANDVMDAHLFGNNCSGTVYDSSSS